MSVEPAPTTPAQDTAPSATDAPLSASEATARHEAATAAASRPGRSKANKRKSALVAGLQADLEAQVRLEPVPKRSASLHAFPTVQVSKVDRAPEVVLSEDRMAATFRLGFRQARASHGVFQGTWYFEVVVTHLGSTGHCRIGWSTRQGELQAPVGYDSHSFCYRDLEGSKVHKALRESYGQPYAEGDVIGCLIHLPSGGRPFERDHLDIVTYKGSLYFKEGEDAKPKALPGSCIAFTKNGELQGTAFRDVTEGTYYPALSMYTMPEQKEGATATFNFGPDFQHAPPSVEGVPTATPMWKRPAQAQAASRASNLRPAESTPSGPAQPAGSVGPPRSIASAPQAGALKALEISKTPPRPLQDDKGQKP